MRLSGDGERSKECHDHGIFSQQISYNFFLSWLFSSQYYIVNLKIKKYFFTTFHR